jgi:hypothetical protein
MSYAYACTSVQTAVCKSLQSIGLHPRKEHQIENAIAIIVRSSGPEYLLARLSDLTDWRKMHMRGDINYHPSWHAYKRHKGSLVPADPIGSQLWGLSDKAFFAAVGALRKSVLLAVPSEKQLSKWLEGVRCENTSDPDCKLNCKASYKILDRMEKDLIRQWTGRHWFDVSDITGTNIPGSGKFMTVKTDNRSFKDPLSLLSAYGFSVNTAPLFVWQFLKDIDAPKLLSSGADCPEELEGTLSEVIDAKLSSVELEDEALQGSSFLDDDMYLEAKKYRNSTLGFAHSVGNIGFLEQPSGKLRTVANPNRLVQYINRPLGEVLSHAYYKQDGYFVLDQNAGFEWAQQKLREGISLSSFDMSSATDRLDYKKFLHSYFSRVYKEPQKFPMLLRSLELFEDTSDSNWSIPGHIADLCNIPGNEVGWTVGQPLGLRPSFPILTIMNATFAASAVYQVDGSFSTGHFACVGDDLIIESKYANTYMDMVTGFNGKINNDKTMVSNRFAEFCSHLVTRSSCYPLKPRFLSGYEGSLQNVEKFTTSGLDPKVPRWVRDLHDNLSKYHLDCFDTIKYSSSATPLSLMERIGVNTLMTAIIPASRDPEKVTLQTLYMRAEQEKETTKVVPKAKDLSTSHAESAYPKFGGAKARPKIEAKYDSVGKTTSYGTLGKVSTDRSTSVELPIKREWDFRKASYRKPTSEITQAKKLSELLGKIDTTVVDDLVESKTDVKGIETSILVDTSQEPPEVSVSHRPATVRKTAEAHANAKSKTSSPRSSQVIPTPEQLVAFRKKQKSLARQKQLDASRSQYEKRRLDRLNRTNLMVDGECSEHDDHDLNF